jgi:hypothetical protein
MSNQASTTEQFNKLIAFRQALYAHGLTQARDAQFELLDALLLSGPIHSFAELSLSPVFRRLWPSAYAAIADGRQDQRWLQRYLTAQAPASGVQVFALDATAWPHPQARTLPGLQYVYSPTRTVLGTSVVVGHAYSILAWVPQAHRSWALPLSVERIPPAQTAVEMGVCQVQQLCHDRSAGLDQDLHVIVGDGSYGNARFLRPLRASGCAQVVRLRRDRVLYRAPGPYQGRGRPRVHGERFAFKDPQTWGPPDAEVEVEQPHWGRVRLQRWDGLHLREAAAVALSVVRVASHLERARPPAPVWLGYQGPPQPSPLTQWQWYQQRWPTEPATRFRKQRLYWTLPLFQRAEQCDRWTQLVNLAQWQLFLARELVLDRPLPWQRPQAQLTPGRVRAGLGGLFARIGTPARPPQPRGKSPGWPKGRPRQRPEQHGVVKKGDLQPQLA